MDDWHRLPVIRQLPRPYRVWAWWLRNGPKRGAGTIGGSAFYRLLSRAGRRLSRRDHVYVILRADGRANLAIDLRDFESFHHTIPVWYRGDKELSILSALMARGGVYVDAGANYGVYALNIARLENVRVIAVEPQPAVADALRSSKESNHFDNLEVVQIALDETTGSQVLAVGSGSGTASFDHARVSGGARRLSVVSSTLDRLVADLQVPSVTCLKLDVEGAEARVLRGASKLLARDQPVVVFEASRAYPQDDVFALLRVAGYQEFWDQETFGSAAPIPPRLDASLTNVVAMSPRDVPRLRELLCAAR
jgi:FkbM family methyltransferase